MSVEQKLLDDTLKRIKTSLNKRYEKDAELYISYQDTLVIKRHLFNKEYDAIKDMVGNNIYSPAVVSRVIAKNLWLIQDEDIQEFKKSLHAIMNQCDWRFLGEIKQQIEENSIEASMEIKQFILTIYYSFASKEECLRYLDSAEHFENSTIKTCFKKVLNESDNKIEIIEKYANRYLFIRDDRNILTAVINALSPNERETFIASITEIISQNVEMRTEPPVIYLYGLFRFENALELLLGIGDDLNSYGYFYKWKVLCKIIKKYFKTIRDEADMEKMASQLAEYYMDAPEGVQNCFNNNIFLKASEFGKMKEAFVKGLKTFIDEDELNVADESDKPAKITSGRDLYNFIENTPGSGEGWCGFICYNIWQLRKKEGAILIDMIDNCLSDNSYSNHRILQIFKVYAERIKKEDYSISEIIQYFYEKKNSGYYNSASDWLHSTNNNYEILEEIEQVLVETIVERNFKQGGKNGAIYKFLFDFYPDKCKKLFDI